MSEHPKTQQTTTQAAPSESPDFGWHGEIPSHNGGDYEKDFVNKPPYHWNSDKFIKKYKQSCFCGKLAFEYAGSPWSAKYCHCKACQRLHGAPFQHAVIFPKISVRMIRNEGDVLSFYSSATNAKHHHVPCKIHCKNCSSLMFDEGRNAVLTFPGTFKFEDGQIPQGRHLPEEFEATDHIFYSQRSVDFRDGRAKWAGHVGDGNPIEE